MSDFHTRLDELFLSGQQEPDEITPQECAKKYNISWHTAKDRLEAAVTIGTMTKREVTIPIVGGRAVVYRFLDQEPPGVPISEGE